SDGHVLVYVRARYYDPKHGRWLHRDPTGYADGGSLYEAFGSNATANRDPMGNEIWVTAEDVVLVRPGGRLVLAIHYYLNKDAFSKGIFAGLVSYSGVQSEHIGSEYFELTGDLRHRRFLDQHAEWRRRNLEMQVEADADLSAQELAVKVGVTGSVAALTAGLVSPYAVTAFSTTTVGFTETTVLGSIGAASFIGGTSLGAGEATSELVLGGDPEQVAGAGVEGFALGALFGAPFGALQPTGLAPAATSRGIVSGRVPKVTASIEYPTGAARTAAAETSPAQMGRFSRSTAPWGRAVWQRGDIDWALRRPDGLTNLQAAERGYAPLRQVGNTFEEVQLHHLNQNPRGSLAEVWRCTHRRVPHNVPPPSWRVTDPDAAAAFRREVPAYWRWRASQRGGN
ncbi:MAG TPA: RHS repeat-associated core domain-containing protein, partial [Phycisphaerae bacterium]|nr:RHS repeat-associated core domain-containing protein [Phycisphaerae bacterium]